MKIIVIGLGSMGKRRINLISKYYNNKIELVGIDNNERRRLEVEEKFNIKTFSSIEDAITIFNPIAAFICTSPINHSNLIMECLSRKLHIFTEINLLKDRYDEIIKLSKQESLKLFLSSTFLYRKEIQFIGKEVNKNSKKINYRYHVGQYLPDWHPWENIKDFFVSDKRTNGCRELFAIEMPWIIDTFGKVKVISVMKDNISSLNLGFPDSYIVTLGHESGHKGVISVDIVSRKAIRNLEIYGEDLHLFWNGTPDSLMRYDIETKEIINIETYGKIDKDSRYADNIIENAYLEEIETFIKIINGEKALERYSFEQDIYTLDLIDRIEGV